MNKAKKYYVDKDNNIFYDRKDAVKKVKEAEKNRKEISEEIYYEEY